MNARRNNNNNNTRVNNVSANNRLIIAAAARRVNAAGVASGPELVAYLFQLQIAAKMMHWQTRSYATHVAIGGLFDKIVELTDDIIEQYMGTYGPVTMPRTATLTVPNMTKAAMQAALRQGIAYLNARMPRDPYLQNMRDSLTSEMAKALYLLTLS